MIIRPEHPCDVDGIDRVIQEAFAGAPHSDGNEAAIVRNLRGSEGLAISLVAEEDEIIGHIAVSPVSFPDRTDRWFGLGPVAVRPDRQGDRIGARLIEQALADLRERGASGCVVLGDPAFYGRFGFRNDPSASFPGVPTEYFQLVVFKGDTPRGPVTYHPAFYAIKP